MWINKQNTVNQCGFNAGPVNVMFGSAPKLPTGFWQCGHSHLPWSQSQRLSQCEQRCEQNKFICLEQARLRLTLDLHLTGIRLYLILLKITFKFIYFVILVCGPRPLVSEHTACQTSGYPPLHGRVSFLPARIKVEMVFSLDSRSAASSDWMWSSDSTSLISKASATWVSSGLS